MIVLITLTTAGADVGPFDLFSNTDGYSVAFETGVSRSALLAGYTSSLVPNGTTIVRVQSVGVCTNYIDITIDIEPGACTNYLATNVNDPLSGDNITITYTDCYGVPGELELAPGAGGSFCAQYGSYILPPGGAIFIDGTCTTTTSSSSTTTTTTTTSGFRYVYVGNTSSSGYVNINSVSIDSIVLAIDSGSFPVDAGQNLIGQTSNLSSSANLYVGFSTPIDCAVTVTDTTGATQCVVSPGGEYFTVDLSGPGALTISVAEEGTACF